MDLTYTLTRARRKSIAIRVSQGEVFVRAPLRMPASAIEAFVQSKASWIRDKVALQADSFGRQLQIREGATVPLLDTTLTVTLQPGRRASPVVVRKGDCLVIQSGLAPDGQVQDHERLRESLFRWYRREARTWLEQRTAYWSERTGWHPQKVRLGDYRSKWGSCTSRGTIAYSWRLLLIPPWVCDYVIVHELAHLREMNHSSRFWALVAAHCPNYHAARTWLRQHGHSVR